jgi:hypothetical protein
MKHQINEGKQHRKNTHGNVQCGHMKKGRKTAAKQNPSDISK